MGKQISVLLPLERSRAAELNKNFHLLAVSLATLPQKDYGAVEVKTWDRTPGNAPASNANKPLR